MVFSRMLWLVIVVACGVVCVSCADNSKPSDAGFDSTPNDSGFTPIGDGGDTLQPGSLSLGPLGIGDCGHMDVTAASKTAGTATIVFDHPDPLPCIEVALTGAGTPTASGAHIADSEYEWNYTISGLRVGSLKIELKYNVPSTSDPACAEPGDDEQVAYTCNTSVTAQ